VQPTARSVFLGLLAGLGGLAHAEGTDANARVSAVKLSRMPESLEVRYALSATPRHLRADATVYVLDPSRGYVLNHKGANGISCMRLDAVRIATAPVPPWPLWQALTIAASTG